MWAGSVFLNCALFSEVLFPWILRLSELALVAAAEPCSHRFRPHSALWWLGACELAPGSLLPLLKGCWCLWFSGLLCLCGSGWEGQVQAHMGGIDSWLLTCGILPAVSCCAKVKEVGKHGWSNSRILIRRSAFYKVAFTLCYMNFLESKKIVAILFRGVTC